MYRSMSNSSTAKVTHKVLRELDEKLSHTKIQLIDDTYHIHIKSSSLWWIQVSCQNQIQITYLSIGIYIFISEINYAFEKNFHID